MSNDLTTFHYTLIHSHFLYALPIWASTYIGVARGGAQGARAPPPNQNTTNDKKLWQHSLAMFGCSFFQ